MTATMPDRPASPLASRPRRTKVVRPLSQRAASRALRRTATPTTGRTWTRRGLPRRPLAMTGVPLGESLTSLAAVALATVPLFFWTGVGLLSLGVLGVSLAALSYVLWARRVVVGSNYVAVRQLGRYHVATADHLKHLELKPSQRGGVLCLHTDDGRCMRLRRAEVADPAVNAALRELGERTEGTRDPLVEELLGLRHDDARLRHRYLADVLQ